MLLATTNCPWDLDEAMRRRLEKRIYIPLPDEKARQELFQICLKGIKVDDRIDIEELVQLSNGYSGDSILIQIHRLQYSTIFVCVGADIYIVCREASMMPLRRMMMNITPKDMQVRREAGELSISMVLQQDFVAAISTTKPSVSSTSINKFVEWERLYASQ